MVAFDFRRRGHSVSQRQSRTSPERNGRRTWRVLHWLLGATYRNFHFGISSNFGRLVRNQYASDEGDRHCQNRSNRHVHSLPKFLLCSWNAVWYLGHHRPQRCLGKAKLSSMTVIAIANGLNHRSSRLKLNKAIAVP